MIFRPPMTLPSPVDGCRCILCRDVRRSPLPDEAACERAEAELVRHLTPEQRRDWRKNGGFNVRGSNGALFRLRPKRAPRHTSVVMLDDPFSRTGGLGISIWPVGLEIHADWALAMLLYLKDDAYSVIRGGCHELRLSTNGIHDYGGRL